MMIYHQELFLLKNKKINIEKCKGCELCKIFCPRNNIRMSDKLNKNGCLYAEFIGADKCPDNCKICITMCPDVAIKIKKK